MNAFLTPLHLRLACPWANGGRGQWEIDQLEFNSARLRRVVKVAFRTSTDLNSTPKVPVLYLLFGGLYPRPCALHDFLLQEGHVRRDLVDLVFLDAMRVENDLEIQSMKDSGIDDDEIADCKASLEGRAVAMYAGVALHTKTMTPPDYQRAGYEPMA